MLRAVGPGPANFLLTSSDRRHLTIVGEIAHLAFLAIFREAHREDGSYSTCQERAGHWRDTGLFHTSSARSSWSSLRRRYNETKLQTALETLPVTMVGTLSAECNPYLNEWTRVASNMSVSRPTCQSPTRKLGATSSSACRNSTWSSSSGGPRKGLPRLKSGRKNRDNKHNKLFYQLPRISEVAVKVPIPIWNTVITIERPNQRRHSFQSTSATGLTPGT